MRVDVDLKVGARGQFDVVVRGEVVASKVRVPIWRRILGTDGFPDEEAALAAVRARLG